MEIKPYLISQVLSQKSMTAAEFNYNFLSTEVSVPPLIYQGSHADVSISHINPVHTSSTDPSDWDVLAQPHFLSNSVTMDPLPWY